MNKISIGSRVRHNNLICLVVGIDGDALELQPVGSSSRYCAPASSVTVIMNEGTNEDISHPLFS